MRSWTITAPSGIAGSLVHAVLIKLLTLLILRLILNSSCCLQLLFIQTSVCCSSGAGMDHTWGRACAKHDSFTSTLSSSVSRSSAIWVSLNTCHAVIPLDNHPGKKLGLVILETINTEKRHQITSVDLQAPGQCFFCCTGKILFKHCFPSSSFLTSTSNPKLCQNIFS